MATTYGGFFIAIALFNLLMFVMLRQRPLLIYAAVVTTALLVMVTDDIAWRYIPSNPFAREFVHEFFGWLYFAITAYFAQAFLDLPRYDPKLGKAIYALVGLSALELVAGLFPELPFWTGVVTTVILIALLLSLVLAGVRAVLRGYRGARFFVVGSAGVSIGVTTNILTQMFALPVPNIVTDLYAIGVAWEALWLTAALADRMSEVARENVALRLSRAQMQELAEVDQLTRVPNRRAFEEHLEREWSHAQRSKTALGIIMLDVDHFKEYNDALGHVAGDVCLFKIAQACAASLKRTGDFFARYGGEEFAAIIFTEGDEDITLVAERMRSAVLDLDMAHPTNRIVSISLGAARVQPTERQSAIDLVNAADHALYA
ncbi:MAG: diguanylate cyclase domain-containing protein, partial [Vulcanimicrobiaceae bacterium]